MKQYITEEQLKEINDNQGDNLQMWWDKNYKHKDASLSIQSEDPYCGVEYSELPLLSIGQMIEFLDEYKVDILTSLQCEQPAHDFSSVYMFKPKDWCDALWEAVKEVLNKENK